MARRALSAAVEVAAAASGRPATRHGVEPLASRFWATGDSDYESSDEEASDVVQVRDQSTPEFIAEARRAGFSMEDLVRAENELTTASTKTSQGTTSTPLATRILDSMVQRRRAGRPWLGPLPPPRVSPVRTLGDELNKAIRSKKLSPWRGETAKGLSPVIAGDAQTHVDRREADVANVQNSKLVIRHSGHMFSGNGCGI